MTDASRFSHSVSQDIQQMKVGDEKAMEAIFRRYYPVVLRYCERRMKTLPRHLAGSLSYMSPEQLQRDTTSLDGRTDLWGLGVVLYELLTGRLPFAVKTKGELQTAILEHDPVPPRQLNLDVPERYEQVCLRLLEKEPRKRFSNARDVIASFETNDRTRDEFSAPRFAT